MLDDTRCGPDACCLHRTTSKYISFAAQISSSLVSSRHFGHRENKAKEKLGNIPSWIIFYSSSPSSPFSVSAESPSSSLNAVNSIISCNVLVKDSISEKSSLFDLLTSIIEFSTKCYVDENEIDLEEIEKYEIETLHKFNNISLSCGTYLNCGYELQILEYNEENDIKNY